LLLELPQAARDRVMAAAKTKARNFFMRLCSSFKLLPFGTRFFRVPILKPKASGFNHNNWQISFKQHYTISLRCFAAMLQIALVQ
jgi:hypothetical protein